MSEPVQRFIRMVFGLVRIASLLGAILFLNLAVGKLGRQWWILHRGQRTEGTIVDFRDKKIGLGRDGSEMFVEPLVRFQPVAGLAGMACALFVFWRHIRAIR